MRIKLSLFIQQQIMHSVECWIDLSDIRRNHIWRDFKFQICTDNNPNAQHNSADHFRIVRAANAFEGYHESGECLWILCKHSWTISIATNALLLQESKELFKCLYMSWAHCPVSTLSLCLLGQCYQHASQLVVLLYVSIEIVQLFLASSNSSTAYNMFPISNADSADIEVTVEFLTELDKLVQLIESPIFACKLIITNKKSWN